MSALSSAEREQIQAACTSLMALAHDTDVQYVVLVVRGDGRVHVTGERSNGTVWSKRADLLAGGADPMVVSALAEVGSSSRPAADTEPSPPPSSATPSVR